MVQTLVGIAFSGLKVFFFTDRPPIYRSCGVPVENSTPIRFIGQVALSTPEFVAPDLGRCRSRNIAILLAIRFIP